MTLLERVHKKWLLWALKRTFYNFTHTSKLLGLSYVTVKRWVYIFDIKIPTKEQLRKTKYSTLITDKCPACKGSGKIGKNTCPVCY